MSRLKEEATSELWVYREKDPDKEPIHGFLQRLTDHDLTLLVDNREETIPLDSVWRIDRSGHSLWRGAIIGGAVGVALSLAIVFREPARARREVPVGPIIAIPTFIGIGIDALHRGQTTVYQRPDRPTDTAAAIHAPGRGAEVSWTLRF